MVDEFLCLNLSKGAFLKVAGDVDIEEGRNTTYGHCCAVLCLDGCQIAEIEPLNCLTGVLSRLTDVVAIDFSHLLHLLQSLYLHRDFLTQTDDILAHLALTTVVLIDFLLFDKEVNTVKSHTTIVAHDTTATVSIGQTSQNVVVTNALHLIGVSIEYAFVVGLAVFCEDFVQLLRRLVAVRCAGLLSHLDAAIGHEGTLQRFVGLQTDDALQILCLWVNVTGTVGGHRTDDFRLHIQHAAFGTLCLLQLLKLTPKGVRSLGRSYEETLVTIVSGVVVLDKVSNVDFVEPFHALEASPFLSHKLCLCKVNEYLNLSAHKNSKKFSSIQLIKIICIFALQNRCKTNYE